MIGSLRNPRWRWLAPVGVLALVAAGTGLASATAQADPGLPPRTAEQLVTDVLQAKVAGFSGTVQSTANLGLPDLSILGGQQHSADSDFVTSLLTGTHSYRVWAAGTGKARVAIPDGANETDIITDGSTTWVWSSADQTAEQYSTPGEKSAQPTASPRPSGPAGAQTPQQVAQQLLAQVGQYSSVSTTTASTVAGRSAYELMITPTQSNTKIGKVEVAVDGATHVPLRLQVFAKQASQPSLEIGFTKVSFAVPSSSTFTFTPPPGAKVTKHQASEHQATTDHSKTQQPKADANPDNVRGDGWQQVVVAKVGSTSGSDNPLAGMIASLPAVSGAWGSGHLLNATLFSVVITNDGRVAVGAVTPSLLYAALTAH